MRTYIISFNLLLVYALILPLGTRGSFYYCDLIERLNCRSRGENKKCGSDGVTYYNMCAVSVGKCKNKDLAVLHDGECRPTTLHSTTVDAVRDIVCHDLVNHVCSRERTVLICGSDNRVYRNLCEFDKARCTNRHLHISKHGAC